MLKPKILKLEITSHCNANCVMCQHNSRINRPVMHMDVDLVAKIIDELDCVEEVQPQFWGEPTLHPKFREICFHIKSRDKRLAFYTNGSNPVYDIKADKIIFSIEADSQRRHLYETIRPGIKWTDVFKNFTDARKHGKKKIKELVVRITETPENSEWIDEIKAFWQQRCRSVVVVPETPLTRNLDVGEPTPYECKRPEEQVVILADGTIVLCCCDWHGTVPVGHVNDGSVLETWNGEKMQAYRKLLVSGEMVQPICNTCGFMLREPGKKEVMPDEG
jgi:MoaA/NifB/PqqE/SkfB family radical SAM enzyme